MLGVNTYTQSYIDDCRARVAAQLAAYNNLLAVSQEVAGAAQSRVSEAFSSFEPHFFNNMVLTLDSYFTHRLRGKEGKDGNALNEVRMLAASLLENDGVMARDNTIKYDPGKSISGIGIGQKIVIDRKRFEALADGFFDQIAEKFAG